MRAILPYIGAGVGILVLGMSIYIFILRGQVDTLSTENKGLKATVKAHVTQIEALTKRETEYKQIEADYEKVRQELKGKANGPVADVLRHAIGVQ